jgi:hypothetical protein
VKGEKGELRGFVRHFGWKLGMWQPFAKICQRGSKKNILGKYILRGEITSK